MRDLLTDDGAVIAFVVAALGAGVLTLAHHRDRALGVGAGAAAVLGAVVALVATDRRAMLSLVALALLAAGAEVVRRVPGWWTLLAAIPGAALLAATLHAPVPGWCVWVLFVAVAAITPCATATNLGAPRVVPLLLAGTAVGMWATTPDTEHTRVMVGAMVGVVVLALDRRLRPGSGGTAALVGLLAWAGVVDGWPRAGAVVGAVACFGVVVLLPMVGRTRLPFEAAPVALVVAVQAAVVVIGARVAGFRAGSVAAVAIAAATWAIAALVLRRGLTRARS